MKVTINVECTPEEARAFLGLPDLAPLHDVYIDRMRSVMDKGITPDMVDGMIRNWVPMGEAGMNFVQSLLTQFTKSPFGFDTGDADKGSGSGGKKR